MYLLGKLTYVRIKEGEGEKESNYFDAKYIFVFPQRFS